MQVKQEYGGQKVDCPECEAAVYISPGERINPFTTPSFYFILLAYLFFPIAHSFHTKMIIYGATEEPLTFLPFSYWQITATANWCKLIFFGFGIIYWILPIHSEQPYHFFLHGLLTVMSLFFIFTIFVDLLHFN